MRLHLHRYLLLSLSLLPAVAYAQSQTDSTSVAEAAKRTREQKKNAKPVRTLTNDDLPSAPGTAATATDQAKSTAVVEDADKSQQATVAPDGAAATPGGKPAAGAAATPADAEAARKRAAIEEVLKRTKEELKESQSVLDILQRKTALDSDAYYSRTNYAQDTQGKELLDADAQNVNEKKSQVDELKAKVAELQAEVGEAAAEPATPAPPQ